MISGYSSASFDIVDSYFVDDAVTVYEPPPPPPVFTCSDDFYYAALGEIIEQKFNDPAADQAYWY